MPVRPKRPCSYPGCPRLTGNRYCAEHAKLEMRQYNRYRRDPMTPTRYGTHWRKVRGRYLEEHPFCEMCRKAGKAVMATMVHHVKPLREGGTNDEDNLMALCDSCHSRLHAERGDRWHRR